MEWKNANKLNRNTVFPFSNGGYGRHLLFKFLVKGRGSPFNTDGIDFSANSNINLKAGEKAPERGDEDKRTTL
ncbi:MAG: hypothetical protein AB2L18_08610 [Anaerolineaceae bacterium]